MTYQNKKRNKYLPARSKKYSLLVQDEKTEKMIDVKNIQTKCIVSIRGYLFKEEYDEMELKVLKEVYLVKVENKWYYPKLTPPQEEILNNHGIKTDEGLVF